MKRPTSRPLKTLLLSLATAVLVSSAGPARAASLEDIGDASEGAPPTSPFAPDETEPALVGEDPPSRADPSDQVGTRIVEQQLICTNPQFPNLCNGKCIPQGTDCCPSGNFCEPPFQCSGSNSCVNPGSGGGGGGGCTNPAFPVVCNGRCIPQGTDCCPSGGFCRPPQQCSGDGQCSTPGGGGNGCNDPAFPVACNGKCIPQGTDCCSSGNFCEPPSQCTGGDRCATPGGSGCNDPSFPIACNGRCIPAGTDCCPAGGFCVPPTQCTGFDQCANPGPGPGSSDGGVSVPEEDGGGSSGCNVAPGRGHVVEPVLVILALLAHRLWRRRRRSS